MNAEVEHRAPEPVEVGLDLTEAGLSAVPVVGGVVAGLIRTGRARQQRRLVRVITAVVEDHDVRVEQLEDVLGDEQIAEVVEHGVRLALDARSDEKLDLLARIISDAVKDPGDRPTVERSHLLLSLLNNLEGPHIEVLAVVGQPYPGIGQMAGQMVLGTTSEQIRELRPDLADIVAPVIATLEALGLIENVGMGQFDAIERLQATQLGSWLLDTLRSRSEG